MAHFPLPEPGSIAAQARQTLAELAAAARSGPVGPTTILAYTTRLNRQLLTLAEYERVQDEAVMESLAEARARADALAAGTLAILPTRPRTAGGTGGRAA